MGGWGYDTWDLIGGRTAGISPEGGPETEEERRRRIQQAALEAPAEEVQDYSFLEDQPPEREVIQAPTFQGTESPETADVFQQYKDWMGRRPTRESEEYKPSTKRTILSGLAGFLSGLGDPSMGGKVTEALLYNKYNRAKEDWTEEGKTLGEVGKFGQDIAETRRKRESDVLGYEGTQGRIEAQRSGIEQRKEAENLRHQDRMANATEDSERRKETIRHNKEVEKIAGEANRIRTIEAGARKTSAEAYAGRVKQLGETGAAGKPLPPHYRQAVMDALGQMMAEYPDAKDWFVRDPRNKDKVYPKPGLKLSPPDADRFRAFLEDAKVRAKKNLNIQDTSEEDVEDYNPLRQEVP